MRTLLRRTVRRLRALLRDTAIERDLRDEMELHIALETEEVSRLRGLDAGEARRQALLAFGGVGRFREAHRDARGVRWVQELLQDARYAVRTLSRSPFYSLAVVLILALGIGACTAVFSAVNAVLVTRLPWSDDARLVRIFERDSPRNQFGLSTADFLAIEAGQRSFSSVGALRFRNVTVDVRGETLRSQVGFVTSGFFRTLGLSPAAGRGFSAADDRPGASAIAVVSHAFATSRLGGDRAALGQAVAVDGDPYTVVGVLPPGVTRLAGVRSDVWAAVTLRAPTRRGPFGMIVIGRLAEGVTLDAASRDLARVSAQLYETWKASFQDRDARLTPVPLRTVLLGDAGRTLGIFAAGVALILIMALANAAGLSLVRATGRTREVALRAALGATRGRLGRLLVTESLVLAAAGAALGLTLGAVLLGLLVRMGPHVPRLETAHVNARSAVFAAIAALVSGVVVGTWPLLHVSRGRLHGDASGTASGRHRGVGATHRTRRLRSALVSAQFALALPLLAGAGLLVNSFLRLERVDPGFDPSSVFTVNASLPARRYASDTAIAAYWARALEQVREIPGVRAAGLATAVPPREAGIDYNNFDLIDRPVSPGSAQPVSPWMSASADYFRALGVPLLEGRMFGAIDSLNSRPVLIVSRSWARHYFPDRSAVGRTLVEGGCTSCPPTTIVGVVADVRYDGLGGTADAAYDPLSQGWPRIVNLFVRTSGDPANYIGRVSAALHSVEPGISLDGAAPMEDRIGDAVLKPRHFAMLLGAFAVAALVLAAAGIFGVLSYTVNTRRPEIGVRVALGAPRANVIRLVVEHGMTSALIGAAIGLAATLVVTRWMSGALFGVSATDPVTLGAVLLLLLLVALAASLAPAIRAAAIDPAEALRAE